MAMQMSQRSVYAPAAGRAISRPRGGGARGRVDAGSRQPDAGLQREIGGDGIAGERQPVFHWRPHVDHGSLLNQGHDPQMAERAPLSVSLPNPDDDRGGCRNINGQPDMRRKHLQAERHGRIHVQHSEQHRDMSAMVPTMLSAHADHMAAVENQHDAKRRDPDGRGSAESSPAFGDIIMTLAHPPPRWICVAVMWGRSYCVAGSAAPLPISARRSTRVFNHGL